MINNWNRHNMNTDFSRIDTPKGKPSDIDMFYITDNYLILGEIKNEYGTFSELQRGMYEKMLNNCKLEHGIVLYINHDSMVENGDTNVDIANCFVSEYYLKGHNGWHKPLLPTFVQDIFNWCEKEWGQK